MSDAGPYPGAFVEGIEVELELFLDVLEDDFDVLELEVEPVLVEVVSVEAEVETTVIWVEVLGAELGVEVDDTSTSELTVVQ